MVTPAVVLLLETWRMFFLESNYWWNGLVLKWLSVEMKYFSSYSTNTCCPMTSLLLLPVCSWAAVDRQMLHHIYRYLAGSFVSLSVCLSGCLLVRKCSALATIKITFVSVCQDICLSAILGLNILETRADSGMVPCWFRGPCLLSL